MSGGGDTSAITDLVGSVGGSVRTCLDGLLARWGSSMKEQVVDRTTVTKVKQCPAWRRTDEGTKATYRCVYAKGHIGDYEHAYMRRGSARIHPPLSPEDVELLKQAGHVVLSPSYSEIFEVKKDPARCVERRAEGRFTWTCLLSAEPEPHEHLFSVLPDQDLDASRDSRSLDRRKG